MMLRPWGRLLGSAAVTALLTSCVDGADPTAVDLVRPVHLVAAPVFSTVASSSESGVLAVARAAARDSVGGVALASARQDIQPQDTAWTLDLVLELQPGQKLSVVLEAELVSLGEADEEIVEWSGRTADVAVEAGDVPTVHAMEIFRGPLDNLTATRVIVATSATALLEGGTARLTADVQGGGPGTRVYWESLDPGIATVDPFGRVTAHVPGSARVAAIVGPVADTVNLTVEQVVLPSAEEISTRVIPQADFSLDVMVGTLEDPVAAELIATSLSALQDALVDRDGAASVSAFEDLRAAWEAYGDPALRVRDGPQLSMIEITLIHAADALGISFG